MAAKEQRRAIKIPPVIDDIEDELRDLLLNPERLSIHKWKGSQTVWPREVDMSSIFHCQDVPIQAGLQPIRNTNGQIIDWKEVVNYQSNKREDLSMKRPPLPPHLATQGMPNQLPFLPAGYEIDPNENLLLQDSKNDLFDEEEEDIPGTFMGEKLMCETLTTIENNYEGLFFDNDGITLIGEVNVNKHSISIEDDINLTDQVNDIEEIDFKTIINKDNHLIGFWSDSEEKHTKQNKENLSSKPKTAAEAESLLEDCIIQPIKTIPDLPVLKISKVEDKSVMGVTEWAEMLDVTKPVEDFEKKIPQMAHTFPFELDTFQKQAILKLEEQGHVFVAAHTSAGKTVVAEYAIALSKRHCTRTVYTSPIKALSNQKYKDFSRTFGDVGLITGDLQINTTASCLVMTTEILRSMLYRGSDVVRDLEYVIFDEVHYINDAERGYVWEEVLILLPPHVSIVMLSATVPNTLEFADWVGRTKKRKVYVVSTHKRPVPLCHYLYTGSSGSSKDERFLIVNQDGVFIQSGFETAIQKKKDRASAFKKDYGPKGTRNFLSPNQEQTMWVAFISHLQKHSLLPVVAFILSRNRCDKTAEALRSIDLTTAREKGRIHYFIQTCLKRLKEPDRKLPQILRMQSILACGIGVHHSGILPILKEIVEMLFANGLVKILFATETFAMGVNMPARTVVFDSVSKFDGLEMRHLLPAEYIQMAGRAGRRGLDDTGAVIILCKKDVPDSLTLKTMMQGKPMRLSSQFRVTYSTMLSLLRATSVSVESVMQRSFREFGEQCKADGYKKELEEVQKVIEMYAKDPLPPHLAALAEFHDVAADYLQEMSELMPVLLEQTTKYILPGRIIAISIGKYVNQLAMCLNFQGPRSTPYKVLILDTENQDTTDEQTPTIEKTDIWYAMCGLARGLDRIGSDQTTLKHLVICVGQKNIIGVTTLHFRFDFALIVADYEKRQIARFRSNPPGSTCKDAVMKLSQLSFVAYNKTKQIEFINLRDGLKIYNGEILKSIERVDQLKIRLQNLLPATNIANFEREFAIVFERKQVERKYVTLKRLVSYEAMALYPDYQRRLEVLKELNYVDDQNRVAMKGRVACEMKTNELIITELVFRNILTDLEPAKIAALLSCLVFQARTQSETPIEKSLLKSIDAIKDVDMELSKVEEKFMVGVDDPACLSERLNFGLVQVVYEWAKGKPFAEIIDLTDVQEGIIVRNIQQLHEVLMNVRDAAKIIGDPMLHAKMEEVSVVIKRDIVFFASLYTQDDVINV